MTGQFLQGLASCVAKIKIVDRQTDRPTPDNIFLRHKIGHGLNIFSDQNFWTQIFHFSGPKIWSRTLTKLITFAFKLVGKRENFYLELQCCPSQPYLNNKVQNH